MMKKAPRRRDDPLISAWVFFRYMVIGMYVGLATVGIFIWWFVYGVDPTDGHSLISFHQLSHWSQCHSWSVHLFVNLDVICIGEDSTLLQSMAWTNPILVLISTKAK